MKQRGLCLSREVLVCVKVLNSEDKNQIGG